MIEIPKDKVLSEKKVGSSVYSIHRRYINELNQVCCLDSNYEYDYALYLDYLYQNGEIAGWIRNTTKFAFSQPIEIRGKMQNSCIPDFIIFGLDGTYEIHEVKGWENERCEAICNQFIKDYGHLQYKLITKQDLIAIQRGLKLWGWVDIR